MPNDQDDKDKQDDASYHEDNQMKEESSERSSKDI